MNRHGRGQQHEQRVLDLWDAAVELTDDVGEQAWLVAFCMKAGLGPSYLRRRRRDLERRGVVGLGSRPLGLRLSMGNP